MKLIQHHILSIFLLFTTFVSYSQDPQFSQSYNASQFVGPSFAGTSEGGRAMFNNRWHFPLTGLAYTTYSASIDWVYKEKSGFGVLVQLDEQSNFHFATALTAGQYAFNIPLGLFNLSLGLQASLYRQQYNYNKLLFPDQIDYKADIIYETPQFYDYTPLPVKMYFDAASSILFYSKQMMIGVFGDHLTRPNISHTERDIRQPIKTSLFLAYKYSFDYYNKGKEIEDNIKFGALVRNSGNDMQMELGTNYRFGIKGRNIILGLWFRGIRLSGDDELKDAIITYIGIPLQGNLVLGYSYDLALAGKMSYTGGAHEVCVVYNFDTKAGNKRKRAYIPCPI